MSPRTTTVARRVTRGALGFALAGASAACAIRLGGGPEELRVVVVTAGTTPHETARAWAAALEPDVVLVKGMAGVLMEVPWQDGDTTGRAPRRTQLGGLVVHHAATERARGRVLHMIVADGGGADEAARETVRALLDYVAREVPHDGIVLLALRSDRLEYADSLGSLLAPAFESVARCEDQHDLIAGVRAGALRLYFRPAVRVRCDAVRGFAAPFPALLARIVLDG